MANIVKNYLRVLEKFFQHQVLPEQRGTPKMSDCTLIGYKGYLSAKVQIDLFNYAHIQ